MSLFRNENLGDGSQVNGVLIPQFAVIDAAGLGAASTSFTAFVSNGIYKVNSISVSFGTASTSGTLQLEKATGTQAVGAGTNVLTGTVSLAGAANTSLAGTLSANPNTIKLASGDRLNVIFAGTMTNLANCAVTIYLERANP